MKSIFKTLIEFAFGLHLNLDLKTKNRKGILLEKLLFFPFWPNLGTSPAASLPSLVRRPTPLCRPDARRCGPLSAPAHRAAHPALAPHVSAQPHAAAALSPSLRSGSRPSAGHALSFFSLSFLPRSFLPPPVNGAKQDGKPPNHRAYKESPNLVIP